MIIIFVNLTILLVQIARMEDPVGVLLVDDGEQILIVVLTGQARDHLLDIIVVTGDLHAANRGEVLGDQGTGLVVK